MRFILNFLFIILLTLLTQIGGLIYILSILICKKIKIDFKFKRIVFFSLFYLLATFFIVPIIAPYFGREKIENNQYLTSNNFITRLFNRNYVTPKLNFVLNNVSNSLNVKNQNLKVVYLDANFPFFNGFPLLPHLSHNDGKKIDISFIYKDSKENITNLKPSISGYGVFVEPKKNEMNQISICKKNGFWQYDFTKYFTFGKINNNIVLSEKSTKLLIEEIINQKEVSKIFIEPHIKNRLFLKNSKIRYHGCKAVRHDDHIHLQIK